jgi:ligand-binding SRPBCC domain-containing protein
MRRPGYFKDEQVKGDFTCMRHEHYFNRVENGTIMIDQFYYEVPYGFLGNLFDRLYLKKYMTRLLQERNAVLKRAAEGSQSNNI